MKHKQTVRLDLLILLLSTLLSAFAACGGGKKPTVESQTETQGGGNPKSNDDPYTPPAVKYNNEEFRIYTWTGTDEWVLKTDVSSTILDSKTYYHLMNVEAETGVVFTIAQEVPGGYGRHTEFISKVAMLSGSDDIDLVCQYSLAAIHGAIEGVYVDLAKLENLNWNAPYWSGDFLESNTFNGQVYYCAGEISRSTIYNMFVMTFNFDLAGTYALGDLYEIVEDGEWTVNKLYTLSKDIYRDLNQSDSADKGDLFGLVCNAYNSLDSYQASCNLPSLVRNDMGELEVNPAIYGNYGSNVVDALRKLFHDNDGAYCNTKEIPEYYAMQEGHSVFEVVTASNIITQLNPSGINYGILPLPKYDQAQETYHTCLGMTYSVFAIPTVANDHKMSAIVMESMAHDGYTDLTPYIFETSLKSRYSKRPQDSAMFDYLRDGVSYEAGRVLDNVDIFALVRRSVRDNSPITVYYKEGEKKFNSELLNINFVFS